MRDECLPKILNGRMENKVQQFLLDKSFTPMKLHALLKKAFTQIRTDTLLKKKERTAFNPRFIV